MEIIPPHTVLVELLTFHFPTLPLFPVLAFLVVDYFSDKGSVFFQGREGVVWVHSHQLRGQLRHPYWRSALVLLQVRQVHSRKAEAK